MNTITNQQLKAKKDNNEDFQLIDVREIAEWEEARLPGTVNIPMSAFQARMAEIEKDSPVVLVCRTSFSRLYF